MSTAMNKIGATGVFVGSSKIALSPEKAIGKGGEADIYDIGGNLALKLFKGPGHPDFDGQPADQLGAKMRIAIHQDKLPLFPGSLPQRVIKPEDLATDGITGEIVGYTMRLLKGAQVLRKFASRQSLPPGFDKNSITAIFSDLHETVSEIHRRGVVIGDFNDLNVLVEGNRAYIIDADSFQYDKFLCSVFTARFLDPLLCDDKGGSFQPCHPYNRLSDWYAFTIMLMQSLIYVDPYGGVYSPLDPSRRITHQMRPLQRITIFHPEVKYPKPALPLAVLPDELLHYFRQVFLLDFRGEFPLPLVRSLRWTRCSACGAEHARDLCPNCVNLATAALKSMTVVRGAVTVSRLFRTDGTILAAAPCEGKLLWLYYEKDRFYRENGGQVFKGELSPFLKFGLCGSTTLIGQGGHLITLTPGEPPGNILVDNCGAIPAFDANMNDIFWIRQGRLQSGKTGFIGDVLEGQTQFMVGERWGFGYYRAGSLSTAFLFEPGRRGINDTLDIPWLKHQVIQTECYFAEDRIWFLIASQEQGKTIHRCIVFTSRGIAKGAAEAVCGDGSWLGAPLGGKCAVAGFLLSATDEGIIRVEPDGKSINCVRKFPDTEGYVDEQTLLCPGKGGLYAINEREISFLKIQ